MGKSDSLRKRNPAEKELPEKHVTTSPNRTKFLPRKIKKSPPIKKIPPLNRRLSARLLPPPPGKTSVSDPPLPHPPDDTPQQAPPPKNFMDYIKLSSGEIADEIAAMSKKENDMW